MSGTSDEAFRKHIASFNDMATAEEWKRRYEAHDSLVKALEEMVYETTSLSPQEDDGSHKCRITKPTLERARAALSQVKGGK